MKIGGKTPLGLVAELNTQTLGRAPDELEDAIRGTVELRDMYGADLLRLQRNVAPGIAVTGIASNMPIDIPIRLRGLSLESTVSAGAPAVCVLSLGLIVPGAGVPLWLRHAETTSVPTSFRISTGLLDLTLYPGSVVVAVALFDAAVTFSLDARALYEALQLT